MGFCQSDELIKFNCQNVWLFPCRFEFSFGLEEELFVDFRRSFEFETIDQYKGCLFGVDVFSNFFDYLHDSDSFAESWAS